MNICVQFSWTNQSYEEQCSCHIRFSQAACVECLDWSPVFVLCGESMCGFLCKILAKNTGVPTWQGICVWITLILLSVCQQPGQMVMLLACSVILPTLRKEQEGAKRLGAPVPSLRPSSPCKSLIVLGRRVGREDKSSGTKEELDPVRLWRRASH